MFLVFNTYLSNADHQSVYSQVDDESWYGEEAVQHLASSSR